MVHGPIAIVALRLDLLSHLCMAHLTIYGHILAVVALLTHKHIRPLYLRKGILPTDTLMTRAALGNPFMGLMLKDQVPVTLGFLRDSPFDFIVVGSGLHRMTLQTLLRRMIHIYLMALLALVHAWVCELAVLALGMTAVTRKGIVHHMQLVIKFQAGVFLFTSIDSKNQHKHQGYEYNFIRDLYLHLSTPSIKSWHGVSGSIH